MAAANRGCASASDPESELNDQQGCPARRPFLQASIRSEGSDGWADACLTEPRREMKTFGFCRLATTFPDGLW